LRRTINDEKRNHREHRSDSSVRCVNSNPDDLLEHTASIITDRL